MAESTSEDSETQSVEPPTEDTDSDAESDAPATDVDVEEADASEAETEDEDASSNPASEDASSDEGTPQAFSAIIDEDYLNQTIDTISVLVDECRIHLNELGFRLAAVDPANVAMDETNVTEDAFESYQADGGVLGVNLGKLEDVVSMADKGDLIHLALDPETRKLHIKIGGLEYTLALIDPDSIRTEPDIPDLDLPAEVVLEGADIDRAIRAADMVSDHITFEVDADEEVFRVHAEGDTDDVDLELERDDLIGLTAAPAHSIFSLDYLKDLNKAIPKDAEVTLQLGEEFPVMLNYEYADGTGSVTQMVAPRIQSD